MASMSLGTLLGYPTKALPQLRNETDPNVAMDEDLGSWYAASFWMTGVVFTPLGGVMSGWLGRRKILLLSAPLVFLGWLITAAASNIVLLFCGRLISSFSAALHMSSVGKYSKKIGKNQLFEPVFLGVYISELAHPKLRGSLLVLPGFFLAFGMLYVWILSYFLTWRITAFASMIPSILLTITLAFLPESPYWLIEDNKESCAK